jgi:hypothetical protein
MAQTHYHRVILPPDADEADVLPFVRAPQSDSPDAIDLTLE